MGDFDALADFFADLLRRLLLLFFDLDLLLLRVLDLFFTTLNLWVTSFEHFLPSSRALLIVVAFKLRRPLLVLREVPLFDLFADFDLEGCHSWGPLTSWKPLVCSKMFLFTFFILLRDLLLPRELSTDADLLDNFAARRADFEPESLVFLALLLLCADFERLRGRLALDLRFFTELFFFSERLLFDELLFEDRSLPPFKEILLTLFLSLLPERFFLEPLKLRI